MAEMKAGYKQTDIGVIPEDWDVAALGNLFEITSSKRVFQNEWRKSGVPFYRARELAVLGEKGKVDNDLFIDHELYEKHKRSYGVPEVGDVLVTGVGTLGKVYVVPDDTAFYFKDGNIIWFKVRKKLNSYFLKQLYYTPLIEYQISESSAGSTVGTYTITGAKKTLIPLPKPEEQKQIAAALSDVDGLIEALSQLITKKRDMKTAAMQQLLTGKKHLPGFEEKNGCKETDIGVIPEDWDIKQLGSLGGFAKGSGIKKDEAQSGTLPCVRYGELYTKHHDVIRRFYSFISEKVSKNSKKLKYGDILFACSGETKEEIGKCASFLDKGQAYAGGDIIILSPHSDDAEFLGYFLNSDKIAQQKSSLGQGDAVVHINAKSLASIPIPLPKPEEQKAIASVLSDMDTEIDALEQRLAKALNLKTGMMQELLTGKTRFIKTDKKQEAA